MVIFFAVGKRRPGLYPAGVTVTPPDPPPTTDPTTPPPGYPSFTHLTGTTDFGMVGNGSFNNQTALTTALAAAKAQNKPLYLPAGTYNYSAHFTMDGVVVFGSSTGGTVLHGTTYADHAVYMTGTGPGLHNVTVSATSRSPRSDNREGNGIYVTSASNYVIRNVHILNVDGAGIMTEFASGGFEKNNVIELTGADGTYHTESSHDIEVSYIKTIETGDDAISFTSYGSQYVYNMNVHHNSVLGNFQSRAITVNSTRTASNIKIHDNHIDGGTAGISIVTHGGWVGGSASDHDVEAYGNTVRNINQSLQNTGTIGGGALHFWNDNATTSDGLNMHDNVVYKPGLYGIYAGGTGTIIGSVTNTPFYLSGTLFRSDNTNATITRTGLTTATVASYPGDLVPSTIGGLDLTYFYAP